MPVSGLVLTVTEEPRLREAVRAALLQEPRITLGPTDGLRWPVVTDTRGAVEEEALLDELAHMPGVLMVEVAYHDFSDVEEAPPELTKRRRRSRRGGRPPGEAEEHGAGQRSPGGPRSRPEER